MRSLHVVLVHHSIVHGGVYFRMAQKFLHLFDRHSLINGMSSQSAAKLVRVNAMDAGCLAKVAQAKLHPTDGDAAGRGVQRDEECWV